MSSEATSPPGALNALAHASSSYLRSAIHQPIHWQEWGEAAFARARAEDKPILLDIGAVWCHWCHVMDRESYESPEVAEIINRHFIAIKVDRDERPDVDSRYQAAVQAISGQGGWPLTAFLTPDGHPFFGGTYFPPHDNWGRPSFRRVLTSIAAAYREKHGEVMESAASVMAAISLQEAFSGHSGELDGKTIQHMVSAALHQFDRVYGGFGDKPKFPHSSALDLVIDAFARTQRDDLKQLITTTLNKMADGGIYDQLAGGFHRYSVDEKWIVPHFEKMSYDNSELIRNYVHAFQATGEPRFADVAKDCIRWIDAHLSDREKGGFYASQDADLSMDDDGDHFTWTAAEARAVLSPEEFEVAAARYDIGEVGEMHHDPHKNVLFIRMSLEQIAAAQNRDLHATLNLLESARSKMLAARMQRPIPYFDRTVFVSWNAMMVSAYLEAAAALDLASHRDFALRSLDRLLAEGWDAQRGRLKHVIAYSDPAAPMRDVAGTLEDYAFLAIACLDAYGASANFRFFTAAKDIVNAMIDRFYDQQDGAFFDMDASAAPALLGALTTRRKPLQDAPTPAANPVAALALIRLYHLTGDEELLQKATATLKVFASVVDHFGIFAATYGLALRRVLSPDVQVVILGEATELLQAANSFYAVNKTVLHFAASSTIASNLPPALAETLPNLPESNTPVALICSGFSCLPPIRTADELRQSLAKLLREN